jgi:hypothetical protein
MEIWPYAQNLIDFDIYPGATNFWAGSGFAAFSASTKSSISALV